MEAIAMKQIPYINYQELDEFYTIPQLSRLLGISKQELREKCEQYNIQPRRNEIGDYGFVRFDVRKLHNALYHESRGGKKQSNTHREDDPWA